MAKEKAFVIYSVIRKAYVIRASTEQEAKDNLVTGDDDYLLAEEILDEEFESEGFLGIKVERAEHFDHLIGKGKK